MDKDLQNLKDSRKSWSNEKLVVDIENALGLTETTIRRIAACVAILDERGAEINVNRDIRNMLCTIRKITSGATTAAVVARFSIHSGWDNFNWILSFPLKRQEELIRMTDKELDTLRKESVKHQDEDEDEDYSASDAFRTARCTNGPGTPSNGHIQRLEQGCTATPPAYISLCNASERDAADAIINIIRKHPASSAVAARVWPEAKKIASLKSGVSSEPLALKI